MKKDYFFQIFKIISICVITIMLNNSCSVVNLSKDNNNKNIVKTLGDLAYDANKKEEGYTIYISENKKLIPYFVLTKDYGKSALLLRKEILEDNCVFDKNGNSYYENSTVDLFLNQDFYQRYPDEIKNIIVNSEIFITQDMPHWNSTKSIKRKVFLLSCTELHIGSGLHTKEGVPLEYFSVSKNKEAKLEGKNVCWGLRSTYIGSSGLSWSVSSDLTVGGGGVQQEIGIRPAICISADTQIECIKSNGELIYIIGES